MLDEMEDYFNYFTEIERYYQSKRASFTLLSTLDWALIENWKEQGIPLDVVIKGVDRAFSRSKRRINSLTYCVNAVAELAKEQKELRTEAPEVPDHSREEVSRYLQDLAEKVRALESSLPEFASRFRSIRDAIRAEDGHSLRETEQVLGALEEKLVAILKVGADERTLLEVKQDVDRSLAPFRRTMNVEQLAMIEQQLWRRKLMERFEVPRLSLFYLI